MGKIWVQLLNDHPSEFTVLVVASALVGAGLAWFIAHLLYRRRTERLRAEIATLKEQRERRIGEFRRLTPPDQETHKFEGPERRSGPTE
jgi:hypothetical protein